MDRGKLTRALLRLYPRAWRERYEEELVALIDETRLSVWEALDLARGAVVEHVREWTDAVLTYLRQTSRERMTDRSGLARFGPLPTAVLAGLVAIPMQLASATVGGVLAARWPTLSTEQELWISAPFWLCLLGLVRLVVLRPRRTPLVIESLAACDLPRLNRYAAFFWKVDTSRPPVAYQPRHSLMRPLEGTAWIGLAVVAHLLMGWISAVDHPSTFTTWQLSFNAGLFVMVMTTAVARGRRFGLASLR